MTYLGLIDRYRDLLPVAQQTKPVTLLEGNTPLIKLKNIPKSLDIELNIYAKYEGLNPTGSFKDRGMTMAVTKAIEEGSQAILCASTGNTSASAAAYAARAGIKAFVLIPDGKIAMGKLAQAMMHGAEVIQIDGNFDDGMQLVKQLADELPITLVNSVNPYRLQGQKTAAFEIIDDLLEAPDYHCLPVGNAGNISAYWMGYKEYSDKHPRMLGYQASGAAPFLKGHPIENPETVATAIRIGNPQSWKLATQAVEQSNGWFELCSDEQILAAQRLLAATEGIFCEPASAISIAGLLQDIQYGNIESGSTVVCTLTGHGLKDPDVAIKQCQQTPKKVAAEFEAVKALLM